MAHGEPRTVAGRPPPVRRVAVVVGALVAIVLVFAAQRMATDIPNVVSGTVPEADDFNRRYAEHPWLGYLHIAPGVVYLLGAPLQLSRRFRTRHYTVHRRLGRVLLTCALVSGLLALAFGIPFAWGGAWEAAATVVFGTWFLACLVLAFRAIRRDDVRRHRRWMIRAFAVAVGIGTIRIWIGVFTTVQMSTSPAPDDLVLPDPGTFALSFWLAFAMHVAAGEWWLRRTPDLTG